MHPEWGASGGPAGRHYPVRMPRRAVLDACVLYPQSIRDSLLYIAQRGLFAPIWSEEILAEVSRNLVPERMTGTSFDSWRAALTKAWPEALATRHVVIHPGDAPGVDQKDLHVLGTAVAEHADTIVTANLKDFSATTCADLGVEIYHPDRFLCELHDERPWAVLSALAWHSLYLSRSHLSVEDILGHLEKNQIAEFPRRIRARLELLPGDGPGRWYPDPSPQTELDGPDWFCVRTNPFPCPDKECDFVAVTMTAAHRVIVWPAENDRDLLDQVAACRAAHRDPQVARYAAKMGPAISFFESARDGDGHPVHAVHHDASAGSATQELPDPT